MCSCRHLQVKNTKEGNFCHQHGIPHTPLTRLLLPRYRFIIGSEVWGASLSFRPICCSRLDFKAGVTLYDIMEGLHECLDMSPTGHSMRICKNLLPIPKDDTQLTLELSLSMAPVYFKGQRVLDTLPDIHPVHRGAKGQVVGYGT